MNQHEIDIFFLQQAKLASEASLDPSTKTGAVIVVPPYIHRGETVLGDIVASGHNQFPTGMEDREEWWNNREVKYSIVVHCEVAALISAGHKRINVSGYTLYTYPFLSCDRCFSTLAHAGIKRFVAPLATPDQLERWGKAFEVVRERAAHMNIEIVEIEF